MAPSFIDTHAHIQEPEFKDDADGVVERALAAGVTTIIVPGVDVETSEAAIRLAERYEGVYAAAGFHPHEASRLDPASLDRARSLLGHPKVVAVGEIGLDYYRMHSPREAQTQAFEAMLGLAAGSRLPVVVHCRDAEPDVAAILTAWRSSPPNPIFHEGRGEISIAGESRLLGVMHYFSETVEAAIRYVDLGFLISVHTSLTHPKALQLRKVVAELPLDFLVIETDSPYGAPQVVRGKRNEPAYVIEAAKMIAQIKGVSIEEVAERTSANAARLFRLSLAQPRTATGASV